MSEAARQLIFDLPALTALGREDFFVSPANTLALAALDTWRSWPVRKLALVGPAAAGKTHLAHVFAAQSGARIVAARALTEPAVPDLARGAVVVEDVPEIAGDRNAEQVLFHLHNLCLAEGGSLLLTGRTAPARWPLVLPDLASRMQGTGIASLETPDESLLAAVMAKQFADRQLDVDPAVISYLGLRIERSFRAARDVVAALDRLSLAEKRPITRHLAARVIETAQEP